MYLHSSVTMSQAPMVGTPRAVGSCGARRCPNLHLVARSTHRVQCRQPLSRTVQAAATTSGTVKLNVQGRQIELTPSIKQYAQDKVRLCVSDHLTRNV